MIYWFVTNDAQALYMFMPADMVDVRVFVGDPGASLIVEF